jgi:acylphosphatase
VQGVNFRASTRREADRLDLSGWVRNNPDGTLEIVAEGQRNQLEELVDFTRQGPPAAQVESLDVDWRDSTGEFNGFTVR